MIRLSSAQPLVGLFVFFKVCDEALGDKRPASNMWAFLESHLWSQKQIVFFSYGCLPYDGTGVVKIYIINIVSSYIYKQGIRILDR